MLPCICLGLWGIHGPSASEDLAQSKCSANTGPAEQIGASLSDGETGRDRRVELGGKPQATSVFISEERIASLVQHSLLCGEGRGELWSVVSFHCVKVSSII